MILLDNSIIFTGIPSIQRSLHLSPTGLSWVQDAYTLVFGGLLLVGSRIGDVLGRRRVFVVGLAVFATASFLVGIAPTGWFAIVARALQGVGAAIVAPSSLALLQASFPAGRERSRAVAWYGATAGIGASLGLAVGGALADWVSWRAGFFINVPIGLLGVVLVSVFIDETPLVRGEPFDGLGMVLSGLALGCLFFGFELTSHTGEGARAALLLAVGVAAGALYLRHARIHPAPILDLGLMRVPNFGTSVIAGSLTRITQGAQPFLLPLMLQLEFGLSAAQSGSIVIATAVGSMAMKAFAPVLLRRFGFRTSLIVGGVLASGGYAVCALFRPDWPLPLIFAILVLCGFFMSFQFTAYNTVAFADIPPERMSAATSFYTTFQQLMLSVGICVAALALHGSTLLQGHVVPSLGDFSAAFLAVTTISLAATFWNVAFSPDAGQEISGHQRSVPAVSTAVAEGIDQAKSA